MIRLVLVVALFPMVVHSAPPPAGSEDAKIMGPFKNWITTQHDTLGRWCCDIGDGRPVEAMICASAPRTSGIVSACAYYSKDETSWWVHVTKEHFPDEVERWLVVPEEKITHNANPTGVPILWMWQGRVQCFAPPDGV